MGKMTLLIFFSANILFVKMYIADRKSKSTPVDLLGKMKLSRTLIFIYTNLCEIKINFCV